MPTRDHIVSSHDGLKLHAREWTPPENVKTKATVLFVHGFGEFLEAYDDFFNKATADGLAITSYHQRGHYKSSHPKDYGKSNERHIMSDLEVMVTYMKEKKQRSEPLILWGFSMGGAIVLNYMVIGKRREEIDLYISSGPYIIPAASVNSGVNWALLKILPYVTRVYPGFTTSAQLSPQMATDDPEKWDLYPKQAQQTQRHARSSAEFMNDAMNRGKRLVDPKFIENIVDRPLLVCQGSKDQLSDPVLGAKQFFNLVKLSDKTLDMEEGRPHELMQAREPGRTEHWRIVRTWLEERLDTLNAAPQ